MDKINVNWDSFQELELSERLSRYILIKDKCVNKKLKNFGYKFEINNVIFPGICKLCIEIIIFFSYNLFFPLWGWRKATCTSVPKKLDNINS